MKNLANRTFYKKLHKRILIAFYIVFILIAALFLKNQLETIEHNSIEANNAIASNISAQIDKTIKLSFKLIDQICYNMNVEEYASGKRDYYTKIKISEQIKMYSVLANELGASIALFCPEEDSYISDSTIYHSWDIKQKYGFTLPEAEYLNGMEHSEVSITKIDGCSNVDNYISFLCKRYTINGREVYFLVSFFKDYFSVSEASAGEYGFEIEENGNVIFSNQIETHEKYIERIRSSQVYDWSYIYKFDAQINYYFWAIYVILIAVIAVGIRFLVLKVTEMLYKPIADVMSILSPGYEAVDEVGFIEERFSELNNENSNLRQRLINHKIYRNNQYFKELIYGIADKRTNLEYKLPNFKGNITLVLFDLYEGEENGVVMDYLRNTLKIENAVRLSATQFVIITDNCESKRLVSDASEIIKELEINLCLSYKAVVPAKYVEDILNINEVFTQAEAMLSSKGITGNKMVISGEDYTFMERDSYYYPFEVEKIILENAVRSNYDVAMRQLENVIDENLFVLNLNKTGLTEFRFAMVATMKRLISLLGKSENEVFEEGTILYVELNFIKDKKELKRKILQMVDTILKSEKAQEEQGVELVGEIVTFIKENYQNPEKLTLINVAREFNISQGYLSVIFKKIMGSNFRDYIIDFRMERAKEIMYQHKNLKIKDVANMVGYDNVNSFIRTFKKHEGYSPQSYKELQ